VVPAPATTPRGRARSKPAAASAKQLTAPDERRPKPAPQPRPTTSAPEARPVVVAPRLSEEEEIGSAKYLPRELPPRVFEEERFVFPDSYGVNRVRLLVKDPHWLFAHWDVDPRVRERLRAEKGERVAALARLTLRLTGEGTGADSVVLPEGARSWYLRANPGHRSYRVELGLTLPSGEYRSLVHSNAVSTPRVGPASVKAARRVSYRQAGSLPALASASESAPTAAVTPPEPAASANAAAARRSADRRRSAPVTPAPSVRPSGPEPESGPEPGGASDLFRR
jgi:hypothetical protein